MPITISNASLVIDGSKAAWTVPSPLLFMGEIVRLFNSSSTTQTYDYVGIDGITATATVSATTSSYILVKSGSATDSWNDTTQIATIKLFITASELGNTFTEELITTTGAGSWTKPAGVTQVVVECWGGGGAGGGCSVNDAGGGGGASGQYARKYILYSSPSENINYSIGTGGVGQSGAAGNNGNDTTWNTSDVIAKGGQGGQPDGVSRVQIAQGGVASTVGGVGNIIYTGLSGDSGIFDAPLTAVGGFGGQGAQSTGNNIISETNVEYGGAGGDGISITSGGSNGNPGNNYSSGGSGAAKISGPNRTGGDGAQGLIRILYR